MMSRNAPRTPIITNLSIPVASRTSRSLVSGLLPNVIDEDGEPAADDSILLQHFLSYKCQIASVSGSIVRKNSKTVWRIATEMLVDHEFGFRAEVLDQGVTAIGGDNYPDGMGGNFAVAGLAAGVPAQRRILDPNGLPISEPILLDGDGQPLALGGDPVYSTWSIYPEIDFEILTDFLPIER